MHTFYRTLAFFLLASAFYSCKPRVNFQSDPAWYPFQPAENFDSAVTNMAAWLDKPAGKHGFVQMNGKDLVFENGTPVKFWGVNICSSNAFAEKEKAEKWVRQLTAYGINGVRFHKFTWGAYEGNRSTNLSPEKYARFDQFNHLLREQGIYYGWSHIYGHKVLPGDRDKVLYYEEVAALNYPWSWLNASTSALVNFAPDLQDLNIALTVSMLEHVNPHTGLRYADDPALAFIEFQNEDNIFWGAIENSLQQAPGYRKLLCELFSAWLLKKYGSEAQWQQAWGTVPEGESLREKNVYPRPNHGYFQRAYIDAEQQGRNVPADVADKMQFLYEQQMAFYRKFEQAIRATGYKGVLVGSCWQAGSGIAHYYNLHTDYEVGMIDRHNYFGGGAGGHRLDTGRVSNVAMVSNPGSGLLSAGLQQVADRPFAFSEWMSLIPNEWVAESVPLIGVYGMGLQGWDASFQFAVDFPHFTPTIHTPGVYNVTSPTQMGFYPAVARMIYRGDVQEADIVSERHVHVPGLAQGKLGFLEKVSQQFDIKSFDGAVPPQALARGRAVVQFTDTFRETEPFRVFESGAIASATGQLVWHQGEGGYFSADTPGTKAVVGFSGGKTHTFDALDLQVVTPFSAVMVTALEKNANFKSGKSFLVTAIARAKNTDMEYNATRDTLLAVGQAPILMEPVQMVLHWKGKGKPVVHVLDHTGHRTGRYVETDGKHIVLDGAVHQTFYYEIALMP